MDVEQKLALLGLVLPPPVKVPPGLELPFAFVRVRGSRAYVAGHGPQSADGSIAGPFGKVGGGGSVPEAYQAARRTALSMLGSLQRELGNLDRVTAWLRVFGMVNSTPEFDRQ